MEDFIMCAYYHFYKLKHKQIETHDTFIIRMSWNEKPDLVPSQLKKAQIKAKNLQYVCSCTANKIVENIDRYMCFIKCQEEEFNKTKSLYYKRGTTMAALSKVGFDFLAEFK